MNGASRPAPIVTRRRPIGRLALATSRDDAAPTMIELRQMAAIHDRRMAGLGMAPPPAPVVAKQAPDALLTVIQALGRVVAALDAIEQRRVSDDAAILAAVAEALVDLDIKVGDRIAAIEQRLDQGQPAA